MNDVLSRTMSLPYEVAPRLPYDCARCAGTHHPECRDCLRREPGGEYQWMIAPPEFEEVCPMKIQEIES